jgi:hypothetical protein
MLSIRLQYSSLLLLFRHLFFYFVYVKRTEAVCSCQAAAVSHSLRHSSLASLCAVGTTAYWELLLVLSTLTGLPPSIPCSLSLSHLLILLSAFLTVTHTLFLMTSHVEQKGRKRREQPLLLHPRRPFPLSLPRSIKKQEPLPLCSSPSPVSLLAQLSNIY